MSPLITLEKEEKLCAPYNARISTNLLFTILPIKKAGVPRTPIRSPSKVLLSTICFASELLNFS